MPDPLVSIILPTHNGSRFLHHAIESCLSQSYSHWELILVDDASTDNTPDIISRYVSQDRRIKSVRHAVNRKLPASLNSGFALAQGDLLTWTSDDNCYRVPALESMVACLEENPDVGIVYADATLIDDAGREIGRLSAPPPEELPYWNSVGACFLYRRLVPDTMGNYDESLFLAEDHEYWLRAFTTFRFHHLSEDLYLYRVHEGALSQTRSEAVKLAVRRMLEHYLSQILRDGRCRSLSYLRLARDAAALKQKPRATRYLLQAALSHPGTLFTKFALPAPVQILFGPSGYDRIKSMAAKLKKALLPDGMPRGKQT
jgi:glycosyltransferase involved in cell wall biosynthesis